MAAKGPRLPERLIDAPSQRLYILSLGLALQALKAFSFFGALIEGHSVRFFFKWMFYDALFLLFLRFLRIPRLTFRWQSSVLQIALVCTINWLLFGNYTLSFSGASFVPALIYNIWQKLRGDYVGVDGYKVSLSELFRGDKHLLGQHTVKLSPISTAKLNPYLESFCIPDHVGHAFIPVLFNNTEPTYITYSLTSLHDPTSRSTHHIKKKDILLRVDAHQMVETVAAEEAASAILNEDEAFDIEFGEYDDPRVKSAQLSQQQKTSTDNHPPLQKTQRLRWIKISKPGILKLDNVQDGRTEVRLRTVTTTIVNCPTAKFVGAEDNKVRCHGEREELSMRMFGVPPLTLEWQRELAGKREVTTVEGLDPTKDKPQEPTFVARELTIPLALDLDSLGEHVYSLNSIIDGIGNRVDFFAHAQRHKADYTRTISVLKPAEFAFDKCRAGEAVNLLQGQDAHLSISARYGDQRDGPWRIAVQYTPITPEASGSNPGAVTKGWTKEVVATDKNLKFKVDAPGTYRLLSAKGQVCRSDILSPETCRVVEVPRPKADIEWHKLHECSGDVGVTANLVLHGTPPFRVHYTTQHNGGHESTNSTVIDGSRGEITLQPERSGSYVYKFTALSDKNYRNIPLNGPVIKQTVHPLASAMFAGTAGRGRTRETTVQSCSGDVVDIPVMLKGTAPWNLELQVVGPSGTEKFRVDAIKKDKHTVSVKIPKDVDKDGGTILVDLISVEDANGCKQTLAVPGVSINVRRVKPTAKFYAKDGVRTTQVLVGEKARLPLRLTGDGPWSVAWRHLAFPDRIRRERFDSANDVLVVKLPGVYEILEVLGDQCPGTVITPEHTYVVEHIPLPGIRLAQETRVSQARNGSYIRAPVCVSASDHVDLAIQGAPPFQVTYQTSLDKEKPDQHQFSSLQAEYRLPLLTNRAGRVFYEMVALGDARYSPQTENPEATNLKWEQQVLARPNAYFKNSARLSYCLNDAFMPRPEHQMNQDGLMLLTGKPPFIVHFTIQNMASSEIRKEMLELSTHEWQPQFPHYFFTTVGSYLITIESVHDASSCEEVKDDMERRKLWVDVAETAMIVPFERRTDVCVGDLLQFQLEGLPPWTIKYRFNDKLRQTIQRQPKYTTVANVPGEFSVVSIAHQQAQCQTTISDVKLKVHEIPSAQVSHGTRFEENIREGEQAEIVFSLIGEPPFTFTYQRAELAQYARGRKPKVLETHTVAGIMSSEYSIFSSAEGTWTVTFIADKWCRYPPAKTDPSIESV